MTSHPASACWFEFLELKPENLHNQGKKTKQKENCKSHFYLFFCGMNLLNNSNASFFILDWGCSIHMIINKASFILLTNSDKNQEINTGKKNSTITIKAIGKAMLITKDLNLKLSNVSWVQESTVNSILLGALMLCGAKLQVNPNNSPNTFQLTFNNSTLVSVDFHH